MPGRLDAQDAVSAQGVSVNQIDRELLLEEKVRDTLAHRDGCQVIALLVKGRMLIEAFKAKPGITMQQIDEHIAAVDSLIAGEE